MTTQPVFGTGDHQVQPLDLTDTNPADNTPASNHQSSRAPWGTSTVVDVSLTRLHLLRVGYLLIGVGLALVQWPSLVHHDDPWPLMEGVVTCLLSALGALSFLGLRHPLKMLPVLFFELAWKLTWVSAVVVPLWAADRLDEATMSVFFSCLLALVVVAVIPWRYVLAQFVTTPGARWRPESHGPPQKTPRL